MKDSFQSFLSEFIKDKDLSSPESTLPAGSPRNSGQHNTFLGSQSLKSQLDNMSFGSNESENERRFTDQFHSKEFAIDMDELEFEESMLEPIDGTEVANLDLEFMNEDSGGFNDELIGEDEARNFESAHDAFDHQREEEVELEDFNLDEIEKEFDKTARDGGLQFQDQFHEPSYVRSFRSSERSHLQDLADLKQSRGYSTQSPALNHESQQTRDLKSINDIKTEEIRQLQASLQSLQISLSTQQKLNDALQKEHSQHILQLKQQYLDEREALLVDLRTRVVLEKQEMQHALEARVDLLNQELKSFREMCKCKDVDVEQLKKEQLVFEEQLKVKDCEIVKMQEEVTAVKSQLETETKKMVELKSEMSELQKRFDEQTRSLNSKVKEIEEKEHEIVFLKSQKALTDQKSPLNSPNRNVFDSRVALKESIDNSTLINEITNIITKVVKIPAPVTESLLIESCELLVKHTIQLSDRIKWLDQRVAEQHHSLHDIGVDTRDFRSSNGSRTSRAMEIHSKEDLILKYPDLVKQITLSLELEIKTLQSTNNQLKNQLDQQKTELSQACDQLSQQYDQSMSLLLSKLKSRHQLYLDRESQFKSTLETIKSKYTSILVQMRNEVENNRTRLWKKLEQEWVKRKQTFSKEWEERVKEVYDHCQRRHSGCRCCLMLGGINKGS